MYQFELQPNDGKDFDIEDEAVAFRYLLIKAKPFKWTAADGANWPRFMGLREISVFGTQTICETACIQGEIAHGARVAGAGIITFVAGGPPWTVNGAGTNFGGPGEPGVGSYIALDADTDHWAIIKTINADELKKSTWL